MKIVFEDGEHIDCSPDDTQQVNVGEILVNPNYNIPGRLQRVWANPPTYAKLANLKCAHISPGQYVMTDSGLKRVASVKR
jgi:hypothetical protein